MTTQEAREFFLKRIKKRLADEGRPLVGFELEYWQALLPEDENVLDEIWKNKKRRAELEALDKKLEAALRDAVQQDVIVDPRMRDSYLNALRDVASEKGGIQLQAIVFAAVNSCNLEQPQFLKSAAILAATLLLLALGGWIGWHLSK